MYKIFLSIGLTLMMGSVAFAQTPPEVLKPYKSFTASMKAGDEVKARKYAYKAWQKSEEISGNTKLTSDLAINYAMINAPVTKTNRLLRQAAFERSIELAAQYGADTGVIYLERMSELMKFQRNVGKVRSGFKTAKKIEKYAEKNNLTTSTYYPEALTYQAGFHTRLENKVETDNYKVIESREIDRGQQIIELSERALAAFEKTNDGLQSIQPILANLYKGYGFEAQKKTVEASLSYQKVMEDLNGVHPSEHPLAAKALERWSGIRSAIKEEGKLDEAEAQGLCRCWPYDKERNENVKPVKRVPPKIPQKALDSGTSGFSIIEFDLDDAGKVISPQVLVSWPKDLYDKSSLRALNGWKYTPRTTEEIDSERQNLITTLRYNITTNNRDLFFYISTRSALSRPIT